MQIFVKNINGKTNVYEVSEDLSVLDLNEMICQRENISVLDQRLYSCGKQLAPETEIMNSGLEDGSVVQMIIPMVGGAQISNTNMEPAFIALCEKYIYNKKICRQCYGTNSAKAKTCRKRKCGRCAKLRPKKAKK